MVFGIKKKHATKPVTGFTRSSRRQISPVSTTLASDSMAASLCSGGTTQNAPSVVTSKVAQISTSHECDGRVTGNARAGPLVSGNRRPSCGICWPTLVDNAGTVFTELMTTCLP